MNFTEYLFDRNLIKERIAEREKGLKENRGLSNLLGFGLGVVAGRLNQDPLRYRDYGPYWWALKQIMNANGYDLGDQSDPMILATYRGESDVETLIMADEFRSEYLRTQIVYNNKFMLDGDSGEFWELFDSDMEKPA